MMIRRSADGEFLAQIFGTNGDIAHGSSVPLCRLRRSAK